MCCLLFLAVPLQGQNSATSDSTLIFIGSQLHYGKILPHSESIAHLSNANPWGFQLEISRMRLTKKSWNACNCFSQNGLSLIYFDFDNHEVLGRSLSLVLFAEPKLSYGKIFLSLRPGIGVSYITHVYNDESNPQNLFFSDHFSGILLLQVNARYWIAQKWAMRGGVSYHHISNGGRKQPNKGMNFPTLSLGVEYAIHRKPVVRRTRLPLQDSSWHFYTGLFYNARAVDESGLGSEERERSLGLQIGFYKPFARMHAAGVAIEGSYDNSLKEKAYDPRVVSLLLRHHFLFGRFDFSQALGFYLFKNYPTEDMVFQRYSIHYQLLKNLQIGFSLKAHLQVAEQMDLRVTLVF